MERLTKKSGEMVWMKKGELCLEPCEVMSDCSAGDIRNLLVRIAAYEDTGLEPEEIKSLSDVKQERDAAIEDIPHTCEYCAYNGVDVDVAPCADCEQMNTLFGEERWEWRGLKEG